MLQFNLKIPHIAVSVNTAADSISTLELNVRENICAKIQDDVQTTTIEVTTSSSDVTDEQQFFFTRADGEDETEAQTRKTQYCKKATEWVSNEEPFSMEPSIKEITKIDGNTKSYSMNGTKANARIRAEQNFDPVLKI